MDKRVTPDQLVCGDQVRINHNEYLIKAIDGPDRIGTYELYVKDDKGNDRIEIVTEAVTLHL